jgi:hypothetical protein
MTTDFELVLTSSGAFYCYNYIAQHPSSGVCSTEPTFSVSTVSSSSQLTSAKTVSTDLTSSSNNCAYFIYFSLNSGTSSSLTIYYNGALESLGDCFSFGTTAHGSWSALTDYAAKGFTSGMQTTLGSVQTVS